MHHDNTCKLRIGIDNISPGEATARNGPGGMRFYIETLIRYFAEFGPECEIIVFTPTWADPIGEPLPRNVRIVKLAGVPQSKMVRVIYQQTILASAIMAHQIDVFYATATIAPLWGAKRTVLAVQFLQHYRWPEAYGYLRTLYLRMLLPLSLMRSRSVIIFTEAAKRDLVRFTGVSPAKVEVVPHGTIIEDAARWQSLSAREQVGQLVQGKPYFVYVSATYGYKNHLFLVRAFGLFKNATKLPHKLLLIGAEVTITYKQIQDLAASLGVAGDVVIAGRLESVGAAYAGSVAATIPTLYETFGFPVVEAMAYGAPVVTSNDGSMAELADDAALLTDATDEQAWAKAMERIGGDEALRDDLRTKGRRRAASFTWSMAMEKTFRVVQRAARIHENTVP